ncbi:group 1 glycosyl transferase [Haladaptatus sp. W1]|uniref:glycosyltransferase n=1 Tax=Haladaptatus sp. W1 TaxID=1897478 RepID=UPI0008499432|nr:glycosyltransferase [Haladaptatus sp. W1]ODR81770.1 group 1 glycosyl transferase [Haladaptatus sp. W1]
MNALFLPNHDDNPYQLLLADALESHGVSVSRGSASGLAPVLSGVARNDPDVLHFHWLHQFVIGRTRTRSYVAAVRFAFEVLISKLLGISIVWTVHNVLQHERHFPRFERRVRALFARQCDEIIVHSPAARDRVMSTYDLPDEHEERITVVSHGNYVGSYENEVSRAEAREHFGFGDDEMVYLFFGNVRSYKNVPKLVETFRTIDDEDARLVIAGNPPNDRKESAKLARGCRADDRVRTDFTYIPDDEIQLYMNAADAVVLPFTRVLTSGSVILAMSFGKPVIAPRLGCLPDVLGPKTELLYDPDDPSGLRTAMKRAPTLDLDEIGRQTRERAMSFDWDVVGERTAAVYRSATDDRPVETRLPGSDAYDATVRDSAEAVTDGGTDDASDGETVDVTAGPSANGRNTREERR